MNSRSSGAFHALSDEDKADIRDLLGQGLSLRQAAMRLVCRYPHASHFAHTHSLIDYRPHTTDPKITERDWRLLNLVCR